MSTSTVKAVYVGAFDPLTLGHFDVISRAAKIFHRLVLGIGTNPSKSPKFSVEQRIEILKEVCREMPSVSVASFDGLAVDFAHSLGATVMVRGLRTEADYVYEMQMAMMNRTLGEDLETVLIPTRQDLSHVSSSLVKEVATLGGDVSALVPPEVLRELGRSSWRTPL